MSIPEPPPRLSLLHIRRGGEDTAACGAPIAGLRAYNSRQEADQLAPQDGIPVCQLCLQETIAEA